MNATAEDTRLTREEAAYAHLASFQRGDQVDVGGRAFFQPGTVDLAQRCDGDDITHAWVGVSGCAVPIRVTVASLLSGKHTIASRADAAAGRTQYFDEVSWVMQNPEG